MRLILCLAMGLFSNISSAVVEDFYIGAATVTLNDRQSVIIGSAPTSQQVNFPPGAFTDIPAVFLLPDNTNPEPTTLRVYDVTSTGFKVFVSEPEGNFNGVNPVAYPTQAIEYLAIEKGSFFLQQVHKIVSSVTRQM